MSTDDWEHGLQHLQQKLREYARAFEKTPAACHAFFSPEPIRQWNLPVGFDFQELSLLAPFCNSDRWQRLYSTLRQDQKTVEILDMFLTKDRWEVDYEKYQIIAGELLDVIFGSEEQARRLLGLDVQVSSAALWTLVLFRLATQRIDGFGLSPLGARKDEDVFQTLWPLDGISCRCEPISVDDPPIGERLLLPELYTGSAWVLSETDGMLHMPSGESSPLDESIPCTIRFLPPLLLFNSSGFSLEKPDDPPLVYYAWTGDDNVQKVSITRPDGSSMEGFDMKRIRSLSPLFCFQDGWAEDYRCDPHLCEEDCPDAVTKNFAKFEGNAIICEVERKHPRAWTTKASHSIPLRMVFKTYADEEDVCLIVWPHEAKSASPSFVESHLPILQPLEPNAIYARPSSLTEAEGLLEEIHNRERSRYEVPMCYERFPQQRITNVIQILDNLFEASSKVVTMVLAKGKDWIWDNMSRTAPIFAEAWLEGEYSSAECRALVERIRESAGESGNQGGDADDSSKDGNSLRFPSDSDYDGQISLIPPKRRQGRRRHLRRAWIQERLDEGLEVEGIINAWNQGGPELWKKIDPKNPNPYLVKTSDQLNASKKRIRSLIDRMKNPNKPKKSKKPKSKGD